MALNSTINAREFLFARIVNYFARIVKDGFNEAGTFAA
jgi:hypothetical protein